MIYIDVVKSLLGLKMKITGLHWRKQCSCGTSKLRCRKLARRAGLDTAVRGIMHHEPDNSKSRECSSIMTSVKARWQNHWIPLNLSARHGYLGIVKPLLERCANVRHALDDAGEISYQLSLRRLRKIAALLREHSTGREGSEGDPFIYKSNAISD